MDRKSWRLLVAVCALVLLILSGPAAQLWGKTAGVLIQWIGIGLGAAYFVLRSKQK